MPDRRCNQCRQVKPWPDAFTNPKTGKVRKSNCATCIPGNGRRGSRDRLRHHGEALMVRVIENSKNRKHRGIPSTMTTAGTCPPSCSFYGRGCYAEFHHVGKHWSQVPKFGKTWPQFLEWVARLPAGQLWRHNDAGDLPGQGESLDLQLLEGLWIANHRAAARGFTFTHKKLDNPTKRRNVAVANAMGFTINLSAESLEQADELAALGVAPVAVVLPKNSPRKLRTPAGRPVVICPAQTRDMGCKECQICARPKRTAVVGFLAHGQASSTVSETVSLRLSANGKPVR
jgi:hypothetical protein